MPTQSDYESTAHLLRSQAWSYHDIVALSARYPASRFTGPGPVAQTIDDRYHGVLQQVSRAAVELDEAAAECDRRAEVCRTYRTAVNQYWALPSHIRELERHPVRPAAWVEI